MWKVRQNVLDFDLPTKSSKSSAQCNEKQAKCESCGKIYKNRTALIQHSLSHVEVECLICHKKFEKRFRHFHLRTHSAVEHLKKKSEDFANFELTDLSSVNVKNEPSEKTRFGTASTTRRQRCSASTRGGRRTGRHCFRHFPLVRIASLL